MWPHDNVNTVVSATSFYVHVKVGASEIDVKVTVSSWLDVPCAVLLLLTLLNLFALLGPLDSERHVGVIGEQLEPSWCLADSELLVGTAVALIVQCVSSIDS